MKKFICIIISLSLLLFTNVSYAANKAEITSAKPDINESLLKNVKHMKQSTIRIQAGNKVIYVDPVGIEGTPMDADIVLISHTHGDHFSIQDIKNVMKKDATLAITADGVKAAEKEGISKVSSMLPNKEYKINGINIKTVPAYNTNKQFHTKESKWVGYIININNANYYFAGDTDIIPEMKDIKADVAFLPVGGTYTMDAQEAIQASKIIKPKIVIPIHFADVVGTTDDAQTFVRGLDKGTKGVILKDLLKDVSHMKQSTIRMQGSKVIYFDPIGIEGEPKDADIIFISHSHGDHFSLEDIKKLIKNDTVLVLSKDCVENAVKAGLTNIVTVAPSKTYEVEGLKFSTVPAYNTNKDFHKKDSKWVGYIVNINNTSYYFAGDTDVIPEMKDIKANVVFLPVGGTYTMTAIEAIEAAKIINPLIAVPIHFSDVVGSIEDAKNFVSGIESSIKGVILKRI